MWLGATRSVSAWGPTTTAPSPDLVLNMHHLKLKGMVKEMLAIVVGVLVALLPSSSETVTWQCQVRIFLVDSIALVHKKLVLE